MAEKRTARVRHLERMLLVNHREEQGLARRLADINSDSRVRGRELDRERIKVRNEWRYNSRLNYQNIAPLLGQLHDTIQRDSTSLRPSGSVDPVNVYLLREYRRNSQVIPSILSSLASEPDSEAASKTEQVRPGQRRSATEESSSDADSDTEDVDPNKITSLVRDIAKIRNETMANKKIDLRRSSLTFSDLLKRVQEKESAGSESDTFTDGTCVLLRRKMSKVKRVEEPEYNLELFGFGGQGHGASAREGVAPRRKRHSVAQSTFPLAGSILPSPSVRRSASFIGALDRQHTMHADSEQEMKKQLEEQERQQTRIKVAIETEKYRRIQGRIGEFLERNKKKSALPLLFEDTSLES